MNCQKVQPLLSEYIDNVLSARDTWEVDKHLALCNPCTRVLNEMRRTVDVLGAAPRFEVSTDFMDKLQGRIAALESPRPRRAWFANLQDLFRPRVLPAWGAAMAACALAVIIFVPSKPPVEPPPLQKSELAQTVTSQNVALAASNPLGDPAAALLADGAESGGEATQ
jgi:anti-sigma factor RsiW